METKEYYDNMKDIAKEIQQDIYQLTLEELQAEYTRTAIAFNNNPTDDNWDKLEQAKEELDLHQM